MQRLSVPSSLLFVFLVATFGLAEIYVRFGNQLSFNYCRAH